MTTEPEDTEALELDTEAEDQDLDTDQQEPANDAEGEEFSIEIDGEVEDEETPLLKQLRQQNRDQARELSEYRKTAKPKIELGPKPTLETCEYDEDKYEVALDAWKETKREAESAEADEQRQAEIRNQEAQRRVMDYQQRMGAIPLPQEDKDKAHETVTAALPHILQAAVLNYCADPAKVVLALAKHPAKLEQLAAEQDPIKFILKVTDIERNLKVVNRKKPPAPESDSIQSGSASLSTGTDKELERLEAAAAKSGDRTKVIAYKKSKKAA